MLVMFENNAAVCEIGYKKTITETKITKTYLFTTFNHLLQHKFNVICVRVNKNNFRIKVCNMFHGS